MQTARPRGAVGAQDVVHWEDGERQGAPVTTPAVGGRSRERKVRHLPVTGHHDSEPDRAAIVVPASRTGLPPSAAWAVIELQRATGNRATRTLLSNGRSAAAATLRQGTNPEVGAASTPTVARQPQKKKKKRKNAGAYPAVERATLRAQQIGHLEGVVDEQLRHASSRLWNDSEIYELGYAPFISALREADEVYAREETASGIVQDIMVGTVLGLISSTALAARIAIRVAAVQAETTIAVAKSWRQRVAAEARKVIKEEGVSSLITEESEPAANAFVDATQRWLLQQGSSPSLTAGGGGPTPGAQFKAALSQLTYLVDHLPDLKSVQQFQLHLVLLAARAGKSGDPGLIELATRLEALSAGWVDPLVEKLTPPFDRLAKAILSRPQQTPTTVERMLWTEWAARLPMPHDALSYRVVRTRLAECGLSSLFEGTVGPMTGSWSGERITSESRQRINLNARVLWLRARGVQVEGNSPQEVHMLFEIGTVLDSLERRVVRGRRGKFVSVPGVRPRVAVDGALHPLAAVSVPPAAENGHAVVIDDFFPGWNGLRYLAAEYAAGGIHSQNRITPDQVGVTVLWESYPGFSPFRYP